VSIEVYADSATGRKGRSNVEINLLRELGLNEDANDTAVLALLDIPNKRILAASLVERRRIVAGIPKLAAIVDNNSLTVFERLPAAEALCTLGDKTWLPKIKAMVTDPNNQLSRSSLKYNAAGLLARGGDFSQFDMVVKGLSDEKEFVRSAAIHELGNFADSTNPVTDSAATLLSNIAKSDKTPRFRVYAIESLEKLAKTKPELKQKIIEALEANAGSADKNVQRICEVKLMMYKQQSEPNNPPK
jgi:HEAT repeat protein